MNELKYRMEPEGGLFRIYAIKDIPIYKIKTGDKGGLVERESNLSQNGTCWIFGNVVIRSNAIVCGDAIISGNVFVYGNAIIDNNASISGNTRIYEDAYIGGNARIYGNIVVCGNARVYGNALVYGNAVINGNSRVCAYALIEGKVKIFKDMQVTMPIFNFILQPYNITVSDEHIAIGCEVHTITHWLTNYAGIGDSYKFSAKQIKEYGQLLKIIASMREITSLK